MLNLVLFGPPGAGKGTQSAKLIAQYNLVHLSTGDILRSEVANKTQLGLKAKSLMDAGLLVPDEIVIGMIQERISQYQSAKGFIFDGFPRTVAQAEALDKMLTENKLSITAMLQLNVPQNELVNRLLRRATLENRPDDTPETITKRIQEYEQKTLPVATYYKNQEKLHIINGVGEVSEITNYLLKTVENLL
ncbi:MAG: adenylate kinase [Bacteroidia bacterium]|nr:adenylate kinase [Bacteroidia bacterium]